LRSSVFPSRGSRCSLPEHGSCRQRWRS